jgi:hypothetical protein
MRLTNLRTQVQAALSGEAVPNLNIKGNTFTVHYEGNKKIVAKLDNQGRMYVDVHIVDAATSISKMYWEKRYSQDEDSQVAPDCQSEDGVQPTAQSANKQADYCAVCPWNVWGTSIGDAGTGKGKRCRDVWKIAVIIPDFSNETMFQLRIPPNSLKFWKAYMAQFADISIEEEGNREAHPGDVITRIFFEPDMQGTINFEGVSYINPDQKNYLNHIAENDLAANLIGMGAQAPALPAPAQQKQISAPKQEPAKLDFKRLVDRALAQKQKQKQEPVRETTYTAIDENGNELIQEVVEIIEDDEEAALLAQMEALKAKKVAQQQALVAEARAKQAAKGVVIGQAKTAPAATAGLPRGAVALGAGMRTKAGAPTGGAGISRMAASAARQDAQEAELIEDAPNTAQAGAPLQKKARSIETPDGIPQTNLPGELQSLLAGVMGG